MQPLSDEDLQDAIDDMERRVRTGDPYGWDLVIEVARYHGIRAEALQRHFEDINPLGLVAPLDNTEAERQAKSARLEAKRVLRKFEGMAKIDGREVLLDGKLHTLITENRSRKLVIAFRHSDWETLHISFSKFKAMNKKSPE